DNRRSHRSPQIFKRSTAHSLVDSGHDSKAATQFPRKRRESKTPKDKKRKIQCGCNFCHSNTHTIERCWYLHPHLAPSRLRALFERKKKELEKVLNAQLGISQKNVETDTTEPSVHFGSSDELVISSNTFKGKFGHSGSSESSDSKECHILYDTGAHIKKWDILLESGAYEVMRNKDALPRYRSLPKNADTVVRVGGDHSGAKNEMRVLGELSTALRVITKDGDTVSLPVSCGIVRNLNASQDAIATNRFQARFLVSCRYSSTKDAKRIDHSLLLEKPRSCVIPLLQDVPSYDSAAASCHAFSLLPVAAAVCVTANPIVVPPSNVVNLPFQVRLPNVDTVFPQAADMLSFEPNSLFNTKDQVKTLEKRNTSMHLLFPKPEQLDATLSFPILNNSKESLKLEHGMPVGTVQCFFLEDHELLSSVCEEQDENSEDDVQDLRKLAFQAVSDFVREELNPQEYSQMEKDLLIAEEWTKHDTNWAEDYRFGLTQVHKVIIGEEIDDAQTALVTAFLRQYADCLSKPRTIRCPPVDIELLPHAQPGITKPRHRAPAVEAKADELFDQYRKEGVAR
ncbi:MAG: hypothetical protein MHM6MM_008979, partial [Cercozoa sp. M6MM]